MSIYLATVRDQIKGVGYTPLEHMLMTAMNSLHLISLVSVRLTVAIVKTRTGDLPMGTSPITLYYRAYVTALAPLRTVLVKNTVTAL